MGLVKEFSVQLYSVREETAKDFAAAVRKVAECGYDGVEFAGYGGLDAKAIKALLKETGLKALGSHCGAHEFENDAIIEFNAEIGAKYIICPGFGADTKDGWLKFCEVSDKIGERVKKAGMAFGYHNHSHEFEQKFGGESVFDIYYANTDKSLVRAEIDLYWAAVAGVELLPLMEKYKDRLDLLHVKQMSDPETKKCVDLDAGCIDYKKTAEQAVAQGVKGFILEQEEFSGRPVWEALKANYEYMTKL